MYATHLVTISLILFHFRLCKEIVEDLPVTYELNEEATAWVDRMLTYTVAGGKMNRGLATMSVRNTFAKALGHQLSIKVALDFFCVITIVFVGIAAAAAIAIVMSSWLLDAFLLSTRF
jgi:hypothetical protein